ncbi:MAG: copper resistance protein CopC [Anaerolineales bacterium]|nr:copper resistance protein CopC [Anaerolineales bacterium]
MMTIWGKAKIILGVLLWAGVVFGQTAVVLAHAELQSAEPSPGAQLAKSPSMIKLVFSEAIGEGSTFTVFDRSFTQIKLPVARTQDVPAALVAENVPELPSGVYTIQWLVISEDGHPLTGSFEFSIGGYMLTSTLLAEAASFNPPDILGWIMVILALVLPAAVYYWQKNQRP